MGFGWLFGWAGVGFVAGVSHMFAISDFEIREFHI